MSHVLPQNYRMNLKFEDSIKKGTGRAILVLKANPKVDFNDIIIDACVNNFAYDPQSEGSRAPYLYELIRLSAHRKRLERQVLAELSNFVAPLCRYGLDQLFDLAAYQASNGNALAKEIIYSKLREIGAREVLNERFTAAIDADGVDGLIFLAKLFGKKMRQDGSLWDDDYLIWYAEERYAGLNVRKILEDLGRTDQDIASYLEVVRQNLSTQESEESAFPRIPTYDLLKSKIESDAVIAGPWAGRAPKETIDQLARDMLEEKDTNRIAPYLRLFSNVKFPFDYSVFLGLLRPDDQEFNSLICRALGYFRDKRIRALALANLHHNLCVEESVDLLVENFEEGDSEILANLLESTQDEDDFHSLGQSMMKVFSRNRTVAALTPLLKIYDRSRCGCCRYYAIEIMLENGMMPGWIKEEAAFDSYTNTRELIKKNRR
jgi:hypothetical protein